MLSEAAKQMRRKGQSNRKTPYNQGAKVTGRSEGNQRGEGRWWRHLARQKSYQKRGEGMDVDDKVSWC